MHWTNARDNIITRSPPFGWQKQPCVQRVASTNGLPGMLDRIWGDFETAHERFKALTTTFPVVKYSRTSPPSGWSWRGTARTGAGAAQVNAASPRGLTEAAGAIYTCR